MIIRQRPTLPLSVAAGPVAQAPGTRTPNESASRSQAGERGCRRVPGVCATGPVLRVKRFSTERLARFSALKIPMSPRMATRHAGSERHAGTPHYRAACSREPRDSSKHKTPCYSVLLTRRERFYSFGPALAHPLRNPRRIRRLGPLLSRRRGQVRRPLDRRDGLFHKRLAAVCRIPARDATERGGGRRSHSDRKSVRHRGGAVPFRLGSSREQSAKMGLFLRLLDCDTGARRFVGRNEEFRLSRMRGEMRNRNQAQPVAHGRIVLSGA